MANRLGMGAELKPSYYRQAVKNLRVAEQGRWIEETNEELLFADDE